MADGSSPLARGLHDCLAKMLVNRGIIPARAGSTCLCGWLIWLALGSSPLARGLRRRFVELVLRARIIPARAGSTLMWCRRHPGLWDHPRSRGVYAKLFLNSLYGKGSSPLARGLRPEGLDMGGEYRIIPARAGSTSRQCLRCQPSPDHPRSRGVYSARLRAHYNGTGSSPLARGLQKKCRVLFLCAGIIPARAGSTLSRPGRVQISRDHPRSRGVYAGSGLTRVRG